LLNYDAKPNADLLLQARSSGAPELRAAPGVAQ
jgi:hypothetical protein